MDKRRIENIRVKKSIEQAFFALLKEKSFSEITVTDLVKKSGVARASYYRNFSSKEDIIQEYLLNLRKEVEYILSLSVKNPEENYISQESVAIHLSVYLKEKHAILLLCDNGFSVFFQEETNRYAEEKFGDMPYSSIERYQIYFMAGAFFNVALQWLRDGAKESPAEMAQLLLEMIGKIR